MGHVQMKTFSEVTCLGSQLSRRGAGVSREHMRNGPVNPVRPLGRQGEPSDLSLLWSVAMPGSGIQCHFQGSGSLSPRYNFHLSLAFVCMFLHMFVPLTVDTVVPAVG